MMTLTAFTPFIGADDASATSAGFSGTAEG